ncbi:hypothetical protein [Tautonia plasticadhaerens]|uniref:Uncharacterized protein n=1 Tax=Tautonia plasticadhaerens TaxID=2527974 RepID=A0A518H1X3_9BACT|nr:hypothetical protein [Tautonia plasticadhaerens]QDV34825.1 hypothetical protein ElP_27220 [Tautonia plasticadhaerens]
MRLQLESPRLSYALLGAGFACSVGFLVFPIFWRGNLGVSAGRLLMFLSAVVASRTWRRTGSRVVLALSGAELSFQGVSIALGPLLYIIGIMLVGGWNVK